MDRSPYVQAGPGGPGGGGGGGERRTVSAAV